MTEDRGRGALVPAVAALVVVLVAVLAGGLAGCSGGAGAPAGKRSAAGTATGSTAGNPTGPPSGYPTGTPAGALLTEPGTDLGLGLGATVAWQPRQGLVGTLRLSVDRIERTTFKRSFRDWRVAPRTRSFTPYFVHAHVTNVGDTDVGGTPVPLYGESAANALVEAATFKETFKPCHSSVLPRAFGPGASTAACLVYLVPDHGRLVGAAFRPTQHFSSIVWRGDAVSIAGAS